MLAAQADGAQVKTIEGLTSDGSLARLQQAFWQHNALQCGFCTPGILMSAEAFLLQVRREVTQEEVAVALAGNLCRCTGYTKIVDAIVAASELMSGDDDGR